MARHNPIGKDRRIKKLFDRGMRDPVRMARKLGFQDLEAGELRVWEALTRLGYTVCKIEKIVGVENKKKVSYSLRSCYE